MASASAWLFSFTGATFSSVRVAQCRVVRIGFRRNAMSEQNKRLVRRALEEVFARGNLAAVDDIFHRDFVNQRPVHALQLDPRV